ncbi:MAG: high-affinity nickel-transporter, partial [Pyrinomonadaceae bacterium]|nr:high-affinity nickel-transporter [Pyrinomonadaceae bacterium]
MLAAPLNERMTELSFTSGTVPAGAKRLLARDGQTVAPASRDRLAELIAVPELTPRLALLALAFAMVFGALHAFSPGHGKAVVGAYLVGSRGTPRHAAFLGLTVTITHTLGVFALGLVTLFASQYVLPERLFPILSLISGALVMSIGLSLFVRRLRAQLGGATHEHHHHHGHEHPPHATAAPHQHSHDEHSHEEHSHGEHSHGGRSHSHLPPGTDGSPVTWRSLLALGISGGLLPCPSALVVLLSAISLHRTGFGLLMVLAFSVGLAGTLTGVGLLFLYAGRMMNLSTGSSRLTRVLPVISAFVVACLGAAICYEALGQVWA